MPCLTRLFQIGLDRPFPAAGSQHERRTSTQATRSRSGTPDQCLIRRPADRDASLSLLRLGFRRLQCVPVTAGNRAHAARDVVAGFVGQVRVGRPRPLAFKSAIPCASATSLATRDTISDRSTDASRPEKNWLIRLDLCIGSRDIITSAEKYSLEK
jgi:hypothetical protein